LQCDTGTLSRLVEEILASDDPQHIHAAVDTLNAL
ncbi:hypothetical protein MNBD_GAMMA15-2066, partial [hydrothermal vent metagenome]